MKIMSDWVKCEEELPPCDGYYKISDFAGEYSAGGKAYYDGYGFIQLECYVETKYWRKSHSSVKKYGNQLIQTLPIGIDPPSHSLNYEYKEQPANYRKCVQCSKMHDTIVQDSLTGERLRELEKCKDCVFSGVWTPIPDQAILS